MFAAWKKRREARLKRAHGWLEVHEDRAEVSVPNQYLCPVSLDIMKDPVTLSTGITYDRESIEKWLDAGNSTCPITNLELSNFDLIPNHALRKMIQTWCVDNRSFGVERIPTPKIPVSKNDVMDIHERYTTACSRGDADECRALMCRVRNLMKESERNKRCFFLNGTSRVFSSSFEMLANGDVQANGAVLEEIMSTLTLLRPLDEEAKIQLSSAASLNCLAMFLKGSNGDLGRRNAVLLLKEILPQNQKTSESLEAIEGSVDALFHLINEPIFRTATKATLFIIFHILSSSSNEGEIVTKLVDLGLITSLVEMLPGADKSLCEKILAVLERACGFEEGRRKAYDHALTIPVVVKKMHRVSPMVTDLAVGVLWSLCKNETRDEGRALVEAIQHSAFQKLLLLLQVGCHGTTKEKTTELLKMLNVYREAECIDSSNFRNLERSY